MWYFLSKESESSNLIQEMHLRGNKFFLDIRYSEHPPSRTPTGPAKKFEIASVWDSGKFQILAFYKGLNKPNTVFTSVLTLVSLAIGERKYFNIFTVILIFG